MDTNNEQLKKLSRIFNSDKLVTPEDIVEVLKGIKNIMETFKKDNISLTQEAKLEVSGLFDKVQSSHEEMLSKAERLVAEAKGSVSKETKKAIAGINKIQKELKALAKEIEASKPMDGKDADEEKIVEEVLSKIKLPEYKETVLDDGAKIVAKINELPIDDANVKIDAVHIKNLPQVTQQIIERTGFPETQIKAGSNVTVRKDASGSWVISSTGGSGGGAFTDLTDVPSSYSGEALKVVRVNAGETGLEFVTLAGGGDALTSDPLSQFAATTSAQLAGVISDETGTGALVFADTPTLVSPVLGNATGTSLQLSGLTASEILATDASKNLVSLAVATYPSLAELAHVKGVTSAIQTQLNAKANSSGALTQFIGNGNWKVFYSDGSGDIVELELGADGTFLKSNGAAAAPTFATPAGSGDVSKVGTPVDGQVGVWTGDGTIEGDAALTFDTTTNTLTTDIFAGELTGNASTATALETARTIGGTSFDGTANIVPATITVADESVDTTCFPLFVTAATGDLGPKTNSNLAFNATSGLLTVGRLLVTSNNFTIGSSTPFSDSAGTLTLTNIDALDATTESTIEAAIDTLANLTSIQGQTITLSAPFTLPADPNADRLLFWDDSAGATAYLTPGNGLTISTTTIAVDSASDTVDGIVELATAAETTTGTDATRAVTPDGLAGSDYGKRVVNILVSDPNGDAITTGDGKACFRVPSVMNGWNLVAVSGALSTVSSSGLPTFQVRRSRRTNATTRANADMLTTKLSIDASEFDSVDATTAAVIDTANDDVNTGDMIYIDIDVAGTGAKGLVAELTFQLP